MLETRRLVLEGGYANSESWIDLAKRAEAVGFTPQTWLIIRQTLELAYSKDRFPSHPENMPKRHGNGGVETVVVDPEDFSEWPMAVRGGVSRGRGDMAGAVSLKQSTRPSIGPACQWNRHDPYCV
ncbi:hypothetical protein [Rhodococcus sp. IEGM1428]|uniref:hypothetical protein n=1 Tax=Rhodococcus sp. IEGM1428 TaxID=3392191 RepID=UPI003D0ABF79